jgi:dolichol-phosphate mannosyltransferase
MDRRVVEAFRRFPESQRFVRGLVTWAGFRQTAIEYERQPRHAGIGKYSMWQLLKLGCDAVLSFSVVPLRLATLLGSLLLLGAAVAALLGLVLPWLGESGYGAHTWTNLCLVLFSSVQLLGIGILGEYVGRVHRDVLGRPLYFIDRCRGFKDGQAVGNTADSVGFSGRVDRFGQALTSRSRQSAA